MYLNLYIINIINMDQSLYLGKVWHDWCYSDKSTTIEGIYFYAHQACFLDDLFSIIPKLPITINIYTDGLRKFFADLMA